MLELNILSPWLEERPRGSGGGGRRRAAVLWNHLLQVRLDTGDAAAPRQHLLQVSAMTLHVGKALLDSDNDRLKRPSSWLTSDRRQATLPCRRALTMQDSNTRMRKTES